MQGGDPATLSIGTQVSAKYKGAYCEAKVRTVDKQLKVRVTFKGQTGNSIGSSVTLSDDDISTDRPLVQGAVVKARHPDSKETVEAVVKQILDHSRYTVIFNDGDIATLRRNALCMKSGKHYNASESLDNLPLTHPEHFGSPASVSGSGGNRGGGKRRHRSEAGGGGNSSQQADSDDRDSSSDNENADECGTGGNSSYLPNIGRVVWAENTDKKTKSKDSWFLALIVAPSASDTVKIDTKEDFLIRSFKDGRYYTVSKKDTTKFHKESTTREGESANLKDAVEKAVTFLETGELPPHWDRDILFNVGEDSTTESSESEEMEDEEDEDESPEERDHLVAELYKHMEDRGKPINRTPSIDGRDLDLYKLYKIVDKLGGNVRVTNKKLWRQVAKKLGFETTWCINQVRVHYKRYLQSFEELNRMLGCTMESHPKTSLTTATTGSRHRQQSGSSRVQMRGSSSRIKTAADKDSSFTSSQTSEADSDKSSEDKEALQASSSSEAKQSNGLLAKTKEVSSSSCSGDVSSDTSSSSPAKGKNTKKEKTKEKAKVAKKKEESSREKHMEEMKMTTRPRRDSTSSLVAAMQVKAQKDSIGEGNKKPFVRVDRDRDVDDQAKKLQHAKSPNKNKEKEKLKEKEEVKEIKEVKVEPPVVLEQQQQQQDTDRDSNKDYSEEYRKARKSSSGQKGKMPSRPKSQKSRLDDDAMFPDEKQHLTANVDVVVGDRIKVFYEHDIIYDAKVKKIQEPKGVDDKWAKYYVHYQGWNARYDEWIKRSRIAENLSWNKDRPRKTAIVDIEQLPSVKKKEVVVGGKSGKTPIGSSGQNKQESRAGTPSSVTSRGSRTGSPALKRQSSRTSSNKKDNTDDSEDDSENASSSEAARKSSRLQKTTPVTVAVATTPDSRRSSRKRPNKDESETDEVEVEKDDSSSTPDQQQATPTKAKRGRKGKPIIPNEDSGSEEKQQQQQQQLPSTPTNDSSRPVRGTPTRERPPARQAATPKSKKRKTRGPEDEEDPYAFKEPENLDEVVKFDTPRKVAAVTPKRAAAKEEEVVKQPKIKAESDSTDSSSDEMAKKTLSNTRSSRSKTVKEATTEDTAVSTSSEPKQQSVEEEDNNKKAVVVVPEVIKQEEELAAATSSSDLGKPVLQFTKKQKELFPHLAAIRATSAPGFTPRTPPTTASSSPSTSASSTTVVAKDKSEKAEEDVTTAKSRSRSHSPKPLVVVAPPPPPVDTEAKIKACPVQSKKQRKTPKKPNSSELVESESDSDDSSPEKDKNAATAAVVQQVVIRGGNKRKGNDSDEDEPLLQCKKKPLRKQAKRSGGGGGSISVPGEDNEDQMMDLACGETIPGSPVHPSSTSGPSPPDDPVSTGSIKVTAAAKATTGGNRLEMPFASVPESVSGPVEVKDESSNSSNSKGPVSSLPTITTTTTTLPPRKVFDQEDVGGANTPEEETISTSSRSPTQQGHHAMMDDGSKSPGADSSEVDMDSLKAESLDIEGSSSGDATSKNRTNKKKAAAATNNEAGTRSPAPSSTSRRKRRTRESAAGRGGRSGRGRHSSGRPGTAGKGGDDDTDESEEPKDNNSLAAIANLDDEALAAMAQRSPKSSKFNFYVDFDTEMDSNARIAKIQQNMKDCRKAYLNVKSKLAVKDRQLKKIRRKEREKADEANKSTPIEASA